MKRLHSMMIFFHRCQSGQAMTEYAVMLALFALVATTMVLLLRAFNDYGWRLINLVGMEYP